MGTSEKANCFVYSVQQPTAIPLGKDVSEDLINFK